MREEEFFSDIKLWCKHNPQRIVLPETHDERVVKAAKRIVKAELAEIVLVHKEEDDVAPTPKGITSIASTPSKQYVDTLLKRRRHKGVTQEEAHAKLEDPVWYAMMMVDQDDADGVVCGATHSSKVTYSTALKVLQPHDKHSFVSSCFFMFWKDELFLFADAALNINPTAEQLVDIAKSTAITAEHYGLTPRGALLSYSTAGSAGGPVAKKVQEATKHLDPSIFYGDIQFDAAFSPHVRETKHANVPYSERANVYVFPDLASANIGYKIAQRLGDVSAIGPITQGLSKPVNDLSRGCSTKDIYETILITAYHE